MKKIKEKGKERTVYSHDEAVNESIQYFKGDERQQEYGQINML